MKTILINRTDAIGDTLLTTSLARYLKSVVPDCCVVMLVSPRAGDLVQFCDGVDHYYVLRTKDPLFEQTKFLLNMFKEHSFSHYFHMGGSFLPTFLSFLCRVPIRSGILSKLGSYLFLNKGVRQSRSQVKHHEVLYNMEFATLFSAQFIHDLDHARPFAPKLSLPKDGQVEYGPLSKDKPYVIIHPGMTGHTLNWPMSHYAKLIKELSQESALQIVISHTPSDAKHMKKLKEELMSLSFTGDRLVYFDGSVHGLVNFAHVLKGAKFFIGPSTGTTHMANALAVPQVAIYSPIKVQSIKRWGPAVRDKNVFVFAPGSEESPMGEVSVEVVLQAALFLLSAKME